MQINFKKVYIDRQAELLLNHDNSKIIKGFHYLCCQQSYTESYWKGNVGCGSLGLTPTVAFLFY